MPLYEFKCNDCGHRFEQLCSVGQSADGIACPRCQSGCRRVMSSFSARSAAGSNGEPARAIGGSKCGSCSATSCSTCH